MKKVLIIGSFGMAGHVLLDYLKATGRFEVVDIARTKPGLNRQPTHNVDVTDFKTLEDIILKEKSDYVVNCIGVLNRDAEDNIDKAILLNSYLPHFLARVSNAAGGKLIHISTDCVFNGKTGNYEETSFKDGIGYYAQSKALGEVIDTRNVTLRTSIIGPELNRNGIGLFNWFMQQKGEVNGFTEAIWTGVTTLTLAKIVEETIDQKVTGLHHVVNGDRINKYELLKLIAHVFNKKDVNILADSSYKVDKSLMPGKDINFEVPSYERMLRQLKDYIESKNLSEYDLYKTIDS